MIAAVGRVTCIALLAAIQVAWMSQPIPVFLKALHVALVATAVLRPFAAVLIVGGLTPLVTMMARLAELPFPAPKLLEQMILAASTGALARPSLYRTRIGVPAALVAAIAAASAASMLPGHIVANAPETTARAAWFALWQSDYFRMVPLWQPLHLAALTVECALFGWIVERTIRQGGADAAVRMVRVVLLGVAGVAILGIQQVAAGALRSTAFVPAFLELIKNVRTSIITDLNAAGSLLLLAGVSGMSLVVGGPWRTRLFYCVLLAIVGVGLWITGSRAAMGALLGALALAAAMTTWRRRTAASRMAIAIAVVAIVLCAAALLANYPAARNMPISRSVQARATLLKAGGTMFLSAPVWGIGIGGFQARSAEIAGPAIAAHLGVDYQGRTIYGENAHNNFIQILAEQGAVGLAAMLALLAIVGTAVIKAEAALPDARRRWIAFGILASLVTWIVSHPLLVPEFAVVFWIYLGLAAALTAEPLPSGRPWLAAVAVGCIVVAVPIRATRQLRDADLEHRAIGLSAWQHDDLQRYREGSAEAALYVPGRRAAVIPVRRAPDAPDPIRLELRVDGRLINAVHVGGHQWTAIRLTGPVGDRRFVLLEVKVSNAPSDWPRTRALVRFGKVHAP